MSENNDNDLLTCFTLLALHPRHGARLTRRAGLDAGLAGAVLAELAVSGRIDLVDGNVTAVDTTPVGSALVDKVLADLDGHPPRRPEWWVARIRSPRLWDTVREDLTERGILERRTSRVLGLFPTRQYPPADPRLHERLVEQVRTVLEGEDEQEGRARALAALIVAAGLAKRIAPDSGMARRNAVRQGSWVARAVHKLATARDSDTATIVTAAGVS